MTFTFEIIEIDPEIEDEINDKILALIDEVEAEAEPVYDFAQ